MNRAHLRLVLGCLGTLAKYAAILLALYLLHECYHMDWS